MQSVTGKRPPPALTAQLRAEADGNPFFVEELVKHLAADGRLFAEDGGSRRRRRRGCGRARGPAAAPGPPSATALGPVPGGPQPRRRRRAGRRHRPAFGGRGRRRAGDGLGGGGVDRGGPGCGWRARRFCHALLRQASLAELSAIRRRRLHLRVAEALQAFTATTPSTQGRSPTTSNRRGRLPTRRRLFASSSGPLVARSSPPPTRTPSTGSGGTRLACGQGPRHEGEAAGRPRVRAARPGLERRGQCELAAALDEIDAGGGATAALTAELSGRLGRYLDATGGLDQAIAVLDRGLRAVGLDATVDRSRLLSALGYARTLTGDPRRDGLRRRGGVDRRRAGRRSPSCGRPGIADGPGVHGWPPAQCVETADEAEKALWPVARSGMPSRPR